MGISHHWLLLKLNDPSVRVRLHHTEAGHIHIARHVLADNRDIGFLFDMIFQDLIVVQLIDTVSGSDHCIWFVASL